MDCILPGPSTAICETIREGSALELMEEPAGRWPIDPISGSDFEGYYQTFTITAGLEKLSVATTAATSGTSVETAGGSTRETGSKTSSGGGAPGESGKDSGAGSVVRVWMGGLVVGALVLWGGWLV